MGLNYFFDSYALFALMKGDPNYALYGEHPIVMTVFNLVEFYFCALRDFGEAQAKALYARVQDCIVEIPEDVVFEAMSLRLKEKKKRLSYADCVGYCYARKNNLVFLTGDTAFEKMAGVEFVREAESGPQMHRSN